MEKNVKKKSAPSLRCPIITILGHVDHGKTTLLDTIKKTHIALKEAGGITQHIGAYQVSINSNSSKITFIDTPGHQAFAKMRGRGAKVADIAVLVVAANDGVMPQTIESINHIKEAHIPCIVAINKIDLPSINLEKIKKQLINNGLQLEEYGGDIPIVPLSAKTGEGIPKLFEMILLLTELNQTNENNQQLFKGVVIESELSKNRGPAATVIIRNGSLKIHDEVVSENQEFKIRALIDWTGKNQSEGHTGEPIQILGWKKVPDVGSTIYLKREIGITLPNTLELAPKIPLTPPEISDQNLSVEEEKLKIILKADTAGSLEAIMEIIKHNPNVLIINSGVGFINETNIFLAKTTKALVIGFHQRTPENVIKLAESEKVIIKTYSIIYELLNEIDEVIDAVKKGNLVTILGEAKVLALFNIKDQMIIGIKVIKGRVARGDQIKATREEIELGRAKIKSLRHGKEDVTKIEQGNEAGIILSQKIDLLTGDSIISIG